MKRLIAVLFLFAGFCLPCIAQAQKSVGGDDIDSLYAVLKTAQKDSNKVDLLNKLTRKLINISSYHQADSLSRSTLRLAEELSYKKGEAGALNETGVNCRAQGNYANSLECYLKSLAIYQSINYTKGIAAELGNIGLIYGSEEELKKALEYDFKALNMYLGMKDTLGIARNYGNIGGIYASQIDTSRALEYDLKALELNREIANDIGLEDNLSNIGDVYATRSDFVKALDYWFKALAQCRKIEYRRGIATNLGNIGLGYIQEKKYGLAKLYLDTALDFSKAVGEKGAIKNIYGSLTELDSCTGDYKGAYINGKKYAAYRDSLKNEEIAKKILSAQMNYDFDKKMTAEKAEQARLDVLKADEIKRKSIVTYSVIAILILTLISGGLLLNEQKLKRKKEKTIAILEKRQVEDELNNAQRSLEDYTRSMAEKNELLEQFKSEIEALKKMKSKEISEARIEQLDYLNKATILTEDDWNKFKELFEQVHKGFFTRLRDKLPDLTQAEIRLVCLTKLKLSTKHMAGILGVSSNTIMMTRYRLRKKIGLSEEDNIDVIAENI